MSSENQQQVLYIEANGLRLAYESFGEDEAPVVLLVQGLATQMLGWPLPFCEAIVAQGYRVVRFDNRDIGLSSKMNHLKEPNPLWLFLRNLLGLKPRSPYSLSDMAEDASALLRELGINHAHVVGVSMGGMIVQHMAALDKTIQDAQSIQSLTIMMSSSGARGLPGPRGSLQKLLLRAPRKGEPESKIQHMIKFWQAISSPVYPPDNTALEAFLRESAKRCAPYGANETRQLAAILADGSRVEILQKIFVPTLVIHGDEDPLVPIECGYDIARHIPGAQMEVISGLAHDLPYQLIDRFTGLLVEHFQRAEKLQKA